MSLKGGPELRARLKALKVAFKPVGREWAVETSQILRSTAPRRSGRLANSFKPKNITAKRATVAGLHYGHILDKGSKAYDVVPRKAGALAFPGRGGRTIFSKKVHKPRQAGLGFAGRAGKEALRRNPMAESLIKQWNEAA